MKLRTAFFCLAAAISPAAVACPIGMQFNGNGCSPPYERNMDDWLRERDDYIDSLGPKGPSPQLTPEERTRAFELIDEQRKKDEEQQKKDEERRQSLAKGIWNVESKPTPEGNLCAAVFSKYTPGEGGIVTIMGFQSPKPDAWLIFHGVGLPKSKKVTKLKITLQQDNEPAQTLQVFNYRETRDVGAIVFAVPGLLAALDGMRDTQSFKLTLGDKTVMSIGWTGGTKAIDQLRQCANGATAQVGVREGSDS